MDNIRLFIATYLFSLSFLLNGCVSERVDMETNYESATLYLSLDIPGHNPSLKSGYIDYNNIYVLVFEDAGQDELFRYQAVITAIASSQITLKVPACEERSKYRFVVIANAYVPYIAGGTPKNEALNKLVFDCVGKWNASDEPFSPIPMWGEHGQLSAIKNNMSVNVLMHRALARVDVGALFKFNNPAHATEADNESVWGLNNFKIKEVRVYRTLNKAYVASSADKMIANEVVNPNIPASAKYNSDSGVGLNDLKDADNHPLTYTMFAGSDSYVREIYLPESFPSDVNSSADNVPCIVIGGYYGENNNTHITYYRADFATYNNGAHLTYLPLLRNHRYVFDIRSVGGPGYNEPEQALNSIVSDMTLDVKAWNEIPFNYQVQGNYFYSIDTRKVILDARSTGDTNDISCDISYRTNLNLDPVYNPLTCKWKSSGSLYNNYFDVIVNYAAKTITIKAKNENVGIGAQTLSDQLYIDVENYQFTIDVEQRAVQ